MRSNVDDSGQLTLDGGLDESDDALADAETVRASAIKDLADALDAELARSRGAELLFDMEIPLTYVLADMEAVGIAADTDGLASKGPTELFWRKGAVDHRLMSDAGRVNPRPPPLSM